MENAQPVQAVAEAVFAVSLTVQLVLEGLANLGVNDLVGH
jgi:hypothetical protein